MSGLGGLNKSPDGVVIGLVQLQLPNVSTKEHLAKQTDRIVYMVDKARRNLGTMDLVVFPEYSLHGLSMDTNPEIMCSLDGPEVKAFKDACKRILDSGTTAADKEGGFLKLQDHGNPVEYRNI